jgi:KDO2-lipid IV(A) lauroyltransferase
MKNLRFYLEYKLLVMLGWIIRRLPRSGVMVLGRRAGDLIYYLVPIRKTVTLDHLRRAFPEKTEQEIRVIGRQAYQNLATLCFEHICISYMDKEELLKFVRFEGKDVLDAAFGRGKGVIFVGGHFGNWEYMGGATSVQGYPIAYVVAHIANPYIDERVNGHREKMGVTILSKGMSVRGVLKTLRGNGGMAILIDQDSGRSGIFVDYFGRLCSTPRGPALFALKTGAALVYVSSVRGDDGVITCAFEDIEIDYEAGDTEENIHAIIQRCTLMLENSVRQHPGQWFWMHRRWKTRPEEIPAESH